MPEIITRKQSFALVVVLPWLVGSAAPPSLAEVAKPSDTTHSASPIRVACIGDSITFGMGIPNRERNSYPARLQHLLGDGYQVRNFGRSGADVLLRNNGPYLQTDEHQQALAFKPNVVVCNLGINDHALVSDNQQEFVRDYVRLLRAYATLPTKPRLLIWTRLAPVMPGQRNYEQCLELTHTFTTLLQRVADRTAAKGIDLHTPLAGHAEWFPDHLHPNTEGADVIAQVVAGAITGEPGAPAAEPTRSIEGDAGFEGAPVGDWTRLTTPAGTWSVSPGTAEINDRHVRTGNRSLRIYGGAGRTVYLDYDNPGATPRLLSFWAERWTSRSPFRFRIEQRQGGQWNEIYNGDSIVRVGGFHTRVTATLQPGDNLQLRLLVTSPDASGLLIDDVELVEPKPMVATRVTVDQPTLPALVGADWSAITRLQVHVDGNSGAPPVVSQIDVSTAGTTSLGDIEAVQVFYTGDENLPDALGHANSMHNAQPLGDEQQPSARLAFQGQQQLAPGANYFWITYRLATDANIGHRVTAAATRVQLVDGAEVPVQTAATLSGQRMGVAVRRRGDDGVHTYRIPGLATTNRGTLIGVYDIRRRSGGDLPGDIDVGMSRSTDGGHTWEPMQIIMDMGSDPKWRHDGIGDPAVLVDRQTNTIWVVAVWSHGNRGWNGSQPGMEPAETGQLMLVRSDDDGKTWSEPINITKQVKKPEWCFLLQGPGRGITMSDGTLVFAAQYQDTAANRRLPRSTIIYSRDRGQTWHIGTGAFDDTTEAQVAEVAPGTLMLNCRYNRQPRRVVIVTSDMGKTWQEHPTSRQALIEPRACMASLLAVPRTARHHSLLLFSNPNHLSSRKAMTIKASIDGGNTWPDSQQVLLDAGESAGYSCMSFVDEHTVGILYEGSQAHMTFQRLPIDELLHP